jgi:hypothetical protein
MPAPGDRIVKSNRPAAVLVVVAAVLVACFLRWEEWNYQDTRGDSVFQYRGVLLPWQEAQAPPAGTTVVSVSVHKRTALGFNKYDFVGPPGAVSLAADAKMRAPGR